MNEHSPTPWSTIHQFIFSGDHAIPIASGHKEYATCPNGELYTQAQANAAFIVKASNHFDDLVACVRASLNMVDGDGNPPDWDFLRRTLKSAETQNG